MLERKVLLQKQCQRDPKKENKSKGEEERN